MKSNFRQKSEGTKPESSQWYNFLGGWRSEVSPSAPQAGAQPQTQQISGADAP
jgi:hypothetical protein